MRYESIHMMAKRLWHEGITKEEARQKIKVAFADELKKDKKRLVNLIMTYTRMFWKKSANKSEMADMIGSSQQSIIVPESS